MMKKPRPQPGLPQQMQYLIVAQPISQTLAKIDPSTMSDEELAAIVRGGTQPDVRPN